MDLIALINPGNPVRQLTKSAERQMVRVGDGVTSGIRVLTCQLANVINQLGAQGVKLVETSDGQIELIGTKLQGAVSDVSSLVQTTTGELAVLSKDVQGTVQTLTKLVRTADGTLAALGQVATDFVKTSQTHVQQVAWETNALIRNADGQLTALGEQLQRSMQNLDEGVRDTRGQLTLIGRNTNELIKDLSGVTQHTLRSASTLLFACTVLVSIVIWSKICADALYPWLGRDKLVQLHAAFTVASASVMLMWGMYELGVRSAVRQIKDANDLKALPSGAGLAERPVELLPLPNDYSGFDRVGMPEDEGSGSSTATLPAGLQQIKPLEPHQLEAIGGGGGSKFDHCSGPSRIVKMALWTGQGHIQGIKTIMSGIETLDSYVEGMWGKYDVFPTSEFVFQDGERIMTLKMWKGHWENLVIFGEIEFTTSRGRHYQAVGKGLNEDACTTIEIPSEGVELAGFYGRSAWLVDQLGFYWQ